MLWWKLNENVIFEVRVTTAMYLDKKKRIKVFLLPFVSEGICVWCVVLVCLLFSARVREVATKVFLVPRMTFLDPV